ncbi:MAG TPA: protein phosphatase 2C domain-containing protein [Verrucomicrobiota bacterium]|nr:protein phosphatase 2C domain-containing protein [Verrucomicrobiota bacterium]
MPFTDKSCATLVLEGPPLFPIAIGGVTQRKIPTADLGSNSQDAYGIYIGKNLLIGVVCDGCGSGAQTTQEQNRCSSNEVGARLLVHATVNACLRLLKVSKGSLPQKQHLDNAFLTSLTNALLKSLATTVKAFCGNDQDARESFIFDTLMSTVLGVIVTESRFLVFGCGDGYVGVNDEVLSLKDQEGQYLANHLLPSLCPGRFKDKPFTAHLHSLATSTTEDFRAVLLATDGFAPVHLSDAAFFQNILNDPAHSPQVHAGHDRLLREFRKRLLTGPAKEVEFNDDATLVAVRRTENPDQHD